MPLTRPPSKAALFAALYAVLTPAHDVGDHWVQVDSQATAKGQPGPAGARACAAHCLTYTATQSAALYAANRLFGLGLTWRWSAAGLALSALTHYAADRQGGQWQATNPRGLVRLAAVTGHRGWLARDPGAGYLMDQSWHRGWVAVAAALIAAGQKEAPGA